MPTLSKLNHLFLVCMIIILNITQNFTVLRIHNPLKAFIKLKIWHHWLLYVHIPHSSQKPRRECVGGEVAAPSSGGVRRPGAWRGVPRLPWRVLQVVLLGLLGRPSPRRLWLGRLDSHLLWRQHREEAFPYPWRRRELILCSST